MVRAKNDEALSTFAKVMRKKPWPLFFPDTVYMFLDESTNTIKQVQLTHIPFEWFTLITYRRPCSVH